MGTEIIFVLILPIAALCLAFAGWLWARVANMERGASSGSLKAYVPLLVGFAVSMAGLVFLTYIEGYADFTSLVRQGYYTESQRAVYLPRRLVGQVAIKLVLVLPVISLIVVPLTTCLIRRDLLSFKRVGLFFVAGWLALAIFGWLINLGIISTPYSLASFLISTAAPVLLYGLAIPMTAIWLLPSKRQA